MIDSDAEKRLAALHAYEIMDTPPEEAFDDLTRLTSYICGTPMALVTLLDTERQWFKSRVLVDVSETPIEHAFCAHAIREEGVFLVQDASLDQRFAHNPLVTGDLHLRFYAGAPLITPEGVGIGTLCALDKVPRQLTEDQVNALQVLARQAISMMELRKTVKSLTDALAAKRKAEEKIGQLETLIPICAWCHKIRDDHNFWHQVEDYIAARTDVQFSHGVCPSCAIQVKREMDDLPKI